ncbi:MAG TPA: hypothetical protein VLX58_11455 [Bryobacteraceae bacterium]|nr:hypothetical protein [Bryobacteraceae bacterium]
MRLALENFVSSGGTALAVSGGVAAVALGAWGIRKYLKSRPTPAELERRRRHHLHARGKMGDANLLEYRGHFVFYSYDIGGVGYMACQDLSDLQTWFPADPWSTIGPASIKYDPRNPANSIVLCEVWSGLRSAPRVE